MSRKYILIISLFCLIGGFFTARVPLSSKYSLISSLSVFLFAIPSFYFFCRAVGTYVGIRTIVVLSIFAIAIESFAVWSGFPYGRFLYTDLIGYRLFGLVPWTVPFAWVPLVLGSFVISKKMSLIVWTQVVISALLLVAVDMVIDPGAVSLHFWKWNGTSWLYGVPISNFVGWFFTGLIGTLILRYSSLREFTLNSGFLIRNIYLSLYFITIFWTSVVLFKAMYISFIIGCVLLYIMFRLKEVRQ